MIGLNMDPPETCGDCPCSYWVRSGELEGMMMCEALEKIDPDHDKTHYLVNEYTRPDWCPMFVICYAFDEG